MGRGRGWQTSDLAHGQAAPNTWSPWVKVHPEFGSTTVSRFKKSSPAGLTPVLTRNTRSRKAMLNSAAVKSQWLTPRIARLVHFSRNRIDPRNWCLRPNNDRLGVFVVHEVFGNRAVAQRDGNAPLRRLGLDPYAVSDRIAISVHPESHENRQHPD